MRIVVHGQQAFGRTVLERLLERGDNVVAVCTVPDREGLPVDPLKELAVEKGLPVAQPASWRTREALETMRSFDADVCMMAYVLLFVPKSVLDAPRHGSFQFHPSLLPMHRGPSSINWPIAMGATRTGLTVFWPDDGLDEGPILLQKTCDIGPDETLGDVYFKKLFPMGVDAMVEALDMVAAGTAPKVEQDLSKGSYETWFKKADAKVNWSKPAQDNYNIIRAGNPQPGAWTVHNGQAPEIFDSRLAEGFGRPGTVLSVCNNGITVACSDGAIRIMRMRANGRKIPAAEYAAATGLKVGDVLGD